jgi:hypothetical protein
MGGVNKIRERVADSVPRPQAGLLHWLVFGACLPGRSPFFLFKVRDAHEFFDGNLGAIVPVVAVRGTPARQRQHQRQHWQADRLSVIQILSGNFK